MKTRDGFVSNSSSSSFVVATRKKLTRKAVLKLLGIKDKMTAADLLEPLIDKILTGGDEVTLEKCCKDYGYSSIDELVTNEADNNEEITLLDAGWRVRKVESWGDGGDPVENFICGAEFDIRTKDVVIVGGGGY